MPLDGSAGEVVWLLERELSSLVPTNGEVPLKTARAARRHVAVG